MASSNKSVDRDTRACDCVRCMYVSAPRTRRMPRYSAVFRPRIVHLSLSRTCTSLAVFVRDGSSAPIRSEARGCILRSTFRMSRDGAFIRGREERERERERVRTYVLVRPLFSCQLRYQVINCATSNGEIRKAEAPSLSDRDTSRRVALHRVSRLARGNVSRLCRCCLYVRINDASGKRRRVIPSALPYSLAFCYTPAASRFDERHRDMESENVSECIRGRSRADATLSNLEGSHRTLPGINYNNASAIARDQTRRSPTRARAIPPDRVSSRGKSIGRYSEARRGLKG